MANRFTDTELWDKLWFQQLPALQIALFLHVKDKCDCAGIYEFNHLYLDFIAQKFGNKKKCSEEDLLKINENKKQIEKLPNGRFFLIDFIEFQYFSAKVKGLNTKNNAHLGVIKRLIKNDIDYVKYLAPH